MGCSLEELASTLKDENFENFKLKFPYFDDETFRLTRKGVFFYKYLNIKNLEEKELPDIKYFKINLRMKTLKRQIIHMRKSFGRNLVREH